MIFRKAVLEDLENIEVMLKYVVKEGRGKGLNWTEKYPTREIFEEDILKREAYIIENDEELVGVVVLNSEEDISYKNLLWQENERFIVIHRFMISPNYEGQGYGKRLLGEILEWARKNNFRLVKLDTEEKNIRAQRLYESMGFKPIGEVSLSDIEGVFKCYEFLIENNES